MAANVRVRAALGAKPVARVTAPDLDNLYTALNKMPTGRDDREGSSRRAWRTRTGGALGLVSRNVAVDASPPPIRRAGAADPPGPSHNDWVSVEPGAVQHNCIGEPAAARVLAP